MSYTDEGGEVTTSTFLLCGFVQGAISTIYVTVPYTGIIDTTAETFARCRAEVRQLLKPFANWSGSTDLLPQIADCPPFTFAEPYEFFKRVEVCALQ